jgi:cytochrome b pre-mRNA-processing protein 3
LHDFILCRLTGLDRQDVVGIRQISALIDRRRTCRKDGGRRGERQQRAQLGDYRICACIDPGFEREVSRIDNRAPDQEPIAARFPPESCRCQVAAREEEVVHSAIVQRRRSNEAAVQLHRIIVAQAAAGLLYRARRARYAGWTLRADRSAWVPGDAPAESGSGGIDLAREVAERIFDDLDASLREMGAGDLGVGKRVKKMGEAFYGRVAAYDAGLAAGRELEGALRRNLYGTVQPSAEMLAAAGAYVRNCYNTLKECNFSDLLKGHMSFPPVPAEGVPPSACH